MFKNALFILASTVSLTLPPPSNANESEFGIEIQLPSRSGAFTPCSGIYAHNMGKFVPEWEAEYFLPQANHKESKTQCNSVASRDRPIVFLYHANGRTYTDYKEIGLRLASHGFITISLPHNVELDEAIEAFYDALGDYASDQVALIGHSMGGELMVSRHKQVIDSGKNLKAMALMAPKVSDTIEYQLPEVPAFLGLHWTGDTDLATYGDSPYYCGDKGKNIFPKRSVFRIYDEIGKTSNPDQSTAEKSFIFFNYDGHYKQDTPGVISYTTAFMRRHFYGDIKQDRFLKRAQKMPLLASDDLPVNQQYHPPQRRALATFSDHATLQEESQLFWDVQLYGMQFTSGLISSTAHTDLCSPHYDNVLRIRYENSNGTHLAQIALLEDITHQDYSYLSFRISQEYDPNVNSMGDSINYTVRIITNYGSHDVSIANYGLLKFPFVTSTTISQGGKVVNATKNAMRSYHIPLQDFNLPQDELIRSVEFDFSDSTDQPGKEMRFVLDDIALIK